MFTEEEAMQTCSAFRQMTSQDRHSLFSTMAGDDEGQQQADSAGIVDGDRVQGLEVDGRQDKKIKQFGTSWAEWFASVASVLSLA